MTFPPAIIVAPLVGSIPLYESFMNAFGIRGPEKSST